jgi:hypothetical protein
MISATASDVGRRVVYRPFAQSLHPEHGEIVRVTETGWIHVRYDDGREFRTAPEKLQWE